MQKKLWNMYIDPAVLEAFKKKAKQEGRPMAVIYNRLIKLYSEGKLDIWD